MSESLDNPNLKRRQSLRKNMTTPEILIWQKIRDRQLFNYKFRRQYSVDLYVVDFYCAEKKLAIEIDGDTHYTDDAKIYDKLRSEFIQTRGIKIIRFTNREVMKNIIGVLEEISRNLNN